MQAGVDMKSYSEKRCECCLEMFKPSSAAQKTCSKKCAKLLELQRRELYVRVQKRRRTSLDDSLDEMHRLGFGNNYGKYRAWKDQQKAKEEQG